jgi:hypothetical protein
MKTKTIGQRVEIRHGEAFKMEIVRELEAGWRVVVGRAPRSAHSD